MIHPSIARIGAIGLTLCLVVLVGYLTLTPVQTQRVLRFDKLYHAIAFAAICVPMTVYRPNFVGYILAFSIAYGGAIELIQPYVGRSAEWGDFLADILGALAGGMMAYFIGTRTNLIARPETIKQAR